MSPFGVRLAAGYAIAAAVCAVAAHVDTVDEKGRHVILQAPIALQAALLDAAGLGASLASLEWSSAYAWIGGSTLLLLYGLGWLMDRRR